MGPSPLRLSAHLVLAFALLSPHPGLGVAGECQAPSLKEGVRYTLEQDGPDVVQLPYSKARPIKWLQIEWLNEDVDRISPQAEESVGCDGLGGGSWALWRLGWPVTQMVPVNPGYPEKTYITFKGLDRLSKKPLMRITPYTEDGLPSCPHCPYGDASCACVWGSNAKAEVICSHLYAKHHSDGPCTLDHSSIHTIRLPSETKPSTYKLVVGARIFKPFEPYTAVLQLPANSTAQVAFHPHFFWEDRQSVSFQFGYSEPAVEFTAGWDSENPTSPRTMCAGGGGSGILFQMTTVRKLDYTVSMVIEVADLAQLDTHNIALVNSAQNYLDINRNYLVACPEFLRHGEPGVVQIQASHLMAGNGVSRAKSQLSVGWAGGSSHNFTLDGGGYGMVTLANDHIFDRVGQGNKGNYYPTPLVVEGATQTGSGPEPVFASVTIRQGGFPTRAELEGIRLSLGVETITQHTPRVRMTTKVEAPKNFAPAFEGEVVVRCFFYTNDEYWPIMQSPYLIMSKLSHSTSSAHFREDTFPVQYLRQGHYIDHYEAVSYTGGAACTACVMQFLEDDRPSAGNFYLGRARAAIPLPPIYHSPLPQPAPPAPPTPPAPLPVNLTPAEMALTVGIGFCLVSSCVAVVFSTSWAKAAEQEQALLDDALLVQQPVDP